MAKSVKKVIPSKEVEEITEVKESSKEKKQAYTMQGALAIAARLDDYLKGLAGETRLIEKPLFRINRARRLLKQMTSKVLK